MRQISAVIGHHNQPVPSLNNLELTIDAVIEAKMSKSKVLEFTKVVQNFHKSINLHFTIT